MYTNEVRVRLALRSSYVKPFPRLKPMRHATGGCPPPCVFGKGTYFLFQAAGGSIARRVLVSDVDVKALA